MAIIRVSGNPGAGKTTTCEKLAESLGYKSHYTGDVFRQMAKEKCLSIEEFYKQMIARPELEKEIDNRQAKLMMEADNLIVQGRIAPFLPWNPQFKKINLFFKVSDEEGARRQLKRKENRSLSMDEMLLLSRERMKEERLRYAFLYPHIKDYLDESFFDIVIDTTDLNEEEVFQEVLLRIKPLI